MDRHVRKWRELLRRHGVPKLHEGGRADQQLRLDNAGGQGRQTNTNSGFIVLSNVGNATGEHVNGSIEFEFQGSDNKQGWGEITAINNSGQVTHQQSGFLLNTTSAVKGVKLKFDTGNVSTGTMKLFGLTA